MQVNNYMDPYLGPTYPYSWERASRAIYVYDSEHIPIGMNKETRTRFLIDGVLWVKIRDGKLYNGKI